MILVTGGNGLIGSALKKFMSAVFLSRRDADLTNFAEVYNVFYKYKPEIVIHLAAKVGGVKSNTFLAGDYYRDNILINTNVIECCRVFKVKKLLSMLSSCIYPADASLPYKEHDIHNGKPFENHFAYAYTKRMIDIQNQAYRLQYNCNFISAVLNNLFGENDNFDIENGHVLPSLIRKVYEAKNFGKPFVAWGNGLAYREFTYVEDVAKIILFLLDNYNNVEPINIGNTTELQIKDVLSKICRIFDYKEDIVYTTELIGQFRKPSSNSKLLGLGWNNYTDFDTALQKTCQWFADNYPNIRGVK